MAFANYPMALDEAGHRLFVVTRFPARLLVFDTNTGKIVQSLQAVGDCDDVFYDQARKRIYASGGEGAVSVFEQQAPDRYKELARIATVKGARTSFFFSPIPACSLSQSGDRDRGPRPLRSSRRCRSRIVKTNLSLTSRFLGRGKIIEPSA